MGTKIKFNPVIDTSATECFCGTIVCCMLECQQCKLWFPESCVSCLCYKLICGDRFYLYVCDICNNGKEFIYRLPINWENIVHLALWNLSNSKKYSRKHCNYFEYEKQIALWVNNHWELLQCPSELQNIPIRDRTQHILLALQGNLNKFKCGKEVHKKTSLWALNLVIGPPSALEIILPPERPFTEALMHKISYCERTTDLAPIPKIFNLDAAKPDMQMYMKPQVGPPSVVDIGIEDKHMKIAATIPRDDLRMNFNTMDEYETFKCEFCESEFKYSWNLQRHIRKYHEGNSMRINLNTMDEYETFECGFCKTKFKSSWNLQRHIRKFHQWNSVDETINDKIKYKAFPCNYCKSGFNYIVQLQNHIKKYHPSQVHVCNICNKIFTLKRNLRFHKRQFHPGFNVLSPFDQQLHSETDNTANCNILQTIEPGICMIPDEEDDSHCINTDDDTVGKKLHIDKDNATKSLSGSEICVDTIKCHTNGVSKLFDCTYCNSRFKYNIDLLRHIKKYHKRNGVNEINNDNIKYVQIPICSDGKDLVAMQYVCYICGFKFANKKYAIFHNRQIHNNSIFHECNICKKVFSSSFTLRRHNKNKHPDLDRKASNYNIDIKDHNSFFSKVSNCNIDIKTLKNSNEPDTCIYTIKVHTKDVAKSFDCKYCNSKFKNEEHLQNHIRRYHQGKSIGKMTNENIQYVQIPICSDGQDSVTMQYVCYICGKKYKSKKNVIYHNRVIHNNTVFHECDICNKVFYTKDTFVVHKKKYHPHFDSNTANCSIDITALEILNEPEECIVTIKEDNSYCISTKEYNKEVIKCKVCDKKFGKKSLLKKHREELHSGEISKPMKCSENGCSKSFHLSQQLRSHLMDDEDAGGHNYIIEKEENIFSNVQEFYQWKEDLEEKENVRYTVNVQPSVRKDGSHRRIYNCSRSGKYRSLGTGKRSLKKQGTCKMGVYCPSAMHIYCNNQGIVKCKYYKTHLGHGTFEENILQISIHKRDRLFIAEKTLQGIGVERILEDLHLKGGRSARINRADILNVMNSENLKDVARCRNSRNLNVDKIEMNKYKVSGKDRVPHEVTFLKHCTCTKHCLLCRVCDHSYNCDCGYFNKMNICKHIHAVGGVNIVQSKQRLIDEDCIEEEVQMMTENSIPDKVECKEKIEKVNTILNRVKSSLDKYSIEYINKMISHIEKDDSVECKFEMNGDDKL